MEIVTTLGEAILSPLFQSLLDSLKYEDLFTYARGSKVLEEVSKWEPMLRTIFEVLEDAEEQQMTDGKAPSWFNDLRDLAYDVDDILDELITHVRRRKFHAETSSSKVRKLLSSGLNLRNRVKFSSGMVSEVKRISEKLGNVKARMDISKNVGGRNNRVYEERLARPLLLTSLIEPKVCGRGDDLKAMLDIMNTGASNRSVSVIPIVGMGGVGKTTLAQMVYNDKSLQFNFKAWVSIGEVFDPIAVTKTIVQLEGRDLNSLQSKLKEKLSGKKFLIVLDDLWSDDYDKWTRFYLPFASGAPGSKIIITTRNNKVSLRTDSGDGHPLSYHLGILSNDDCLSLFVHHALHKEEFSEHIDLMEVGKEIAKKCIGLPLAAKILGGLLRGSRLDEWKNLLEHKLWEGNSTIATTLRLSYDNLPPPIRRCFAYCAIFPKEYEFDRDGLVLLWLAEGFIPNLSKGYLYFDELFARCLFQKSAKDTSVFVMHDLIHDLARSVSGGVCFNLDEESSCRESYAEVRHSAFNRGELDIALRFKNFENMKCLRTILALPIMEERDDGFFISRNVFDVWFPKLKCLRVLSLSGYSRVEVPKSIDVLQHLRFLNLCHAKIVTLPESVSKLCNLQVLILRNCKNLGRLPKDLCNLINLQCLDLKDTYSLEGMPLHIGNLSKLHILTKFIVGSGDGSTIKELMKILNLQGEVHVKDLQNVVKTDYEDCLKMKEMEKVEGLVLEWANYFGVYRDKENEKKVLEALQPQKNIARMSVKSYGGVEFPSWFGDGSFKLTFFGWPKLEITGVLQYNLKKVKILYNDSLVRLPDAAVKTLLSESPIVESNGVFPTSLRFLFVNEGMKVQLLGPLQLQNHFSYMIGLSLEGSLESFPTRGLFIRTLQFLSLTKCENLRSLPCNLHSLTHLIVLSLEECPEIESFP